LARSVGQLYLSSLSSKDQDFLVISIFNEDMTMKNVAAQALKKKNMGSLSHRSCEANVTSSKHAHTMKTRSMVKAIVPTAARQTAPPPAKLQESKMQQNASSWMDEFKTSSFNLQPARLKTTIQ